MKVSKSNTNYFVLVFLTISVLSMSCNKSQDITSTGWNKVPAILENIVAPTFPNQEFSIIDYGAKADSTTDCLPAISKAIKACNKAGGGRVIIPPGVYFVKGPIHFQSNVNLHLDKGATLKFSTNPDDYLPVVFTRFEGIELMNYSPLVYAYGKKNIAITGGGILDGQASNKNWWSWSGRKRYGWKQGMSSQLDQENRPMLDKISAEDVPPSKRIFGKGHYLRPTFIEFYRCKNILLKGITIKNAPFWIVHPTLSNNITVDGITTISHGPNNGGLDPESCTNVFIKDCTFSNGDDCISIKSGRGIDGRRLGIPSKNIVIENCQMESGHGGIVIGSGTGGGMENIYTRNCKMTNPYWAIRIKSNAYRGGIIKNLYFKDIFVESAKSTIRINMFYTFGNNKYISPDYPPTLDSVFITNVHSKESKYAVYIKGRKDKPVNHIFIDSCVFNNVKKKNIFKQVNNLSITNSMINGSSYSFSNLHEN